MHSSGSAAGALLLAGVLLALAASAARAVNGNQLGWSVGSGAGTCPFNPLSTMDYSDPCDGSGFQYLVTAVNVPSGLTAVTGEEIYIDMEFASPILPPFWNLGAGECGDGTILMEALFTGFATGTTSMTCRNYWGLLAAGGFHWYDNYRGPGTARLAGVFARPQSIAAGMVADGNYYTSRTAFRTTQADPLVANCGGCTIPGCWVLSTTILTQPVGVGDFIFTSSAGRYFVTWQGAAGMNCPHGFVPAKRETWGRIRSVYR